MIKAPTYALTIAAGLLSGLIGVVLTPQYTVLAVIIAICIFALCWGWYRLGMVVQAKQNLEMLRDTTYVARREMETLLDQLGDIRKGM